jgi:hypothetical protein
MLKNNNSILDFMKESKIDKLLDIFESNRFDKEYIECVVICKKLFDKILIKNIKDKDIIKSFILNIEESNDNIEVIFLKFVDIFDEINILYRDFEKFF